MKAVAEAGAACRACASGGESERLELSGSQQDVGLEFTVLLDSGSQQDVGLEFTVLLDSRPDQDARRDPAVLDSPADHDVFIDQLLDGGPGGSVTRPSVERVARLGMDIGPDQDPRLGVARAPVRDAGCWAGSESGSAESSARVCTED